MSSNANLSYEEACEQAAKLRKQGLSYPQIEEHFKSTGYKSLRTGKPIGSLNVRHMIIQYEKQERQELKDERNEAKSYNVLRSPVQDVLRAVEKVLDLDGIPDSIKMRLAKELIIENRNSDPKSFNTKVSDSKRRGRPPGKGSNHSSP